MDSQEKTPLSKNNKVAKAHALLNISEGMSTSEAVRSLKIGKKILTDLRLECNRCKLYGLGEFDNCTDTECVTNLLIVKLES